MNWGGAISSLFLIVLGSSAVPAASPFNPSEYSDREFGLGAMESLPPEEVAKRCVSMVNAVFAYRQIMRSNPVYGKNPEAGEELDWVDPLMAKIRETGATKLQGAYDHMGSYMKMFGPVTVPTHISELEILMSDRASCQKKYGNGS